MIPAHHKKSYDIGNIKTYKDIPGWINDAEYVYEEVSREFEDGDIVVEIGSLLGQSACRMASLIKESGKKVKFDSIDLFWMIDQTFNNIEHSKQPKSFAKYVNDIKALAPGISIVDVVRHSTIALDLVEYVNFITCDEKYAHRLYDDNTLKFVWLDGDHTGNVPYNDLINFWPKLKSNSIIAGDDIVYPDVKSAVDRFVKENKKEIEELRIDSNYFLIRKK